jgi:prepilin signal peptidase PulO-like enzyme (type II secretory pathway)
MHGWEPAAAGIYLLWLIPVSIFDMREQRIPDFLSFSLAGVLALFRVLQNSYSPLLLAAGLLGPVLLLLLVRQLMHGGIGTGDLKFAACGGLLLPGLNWIPALAIAALLALGTAGPRILIGKSSPATRIPFAPYMGAGFLAVHLLIMLGTVPSLNVL